MRILFIAQSVLLFVGIGYAFRISDFLEVFSDEKSNNERQSEVEDQIVPVFLIAFFASLVNSLFFMNTGAAEGKNASSAGVTCKSVNVKNGLSLCR